MTYIKPRDLKYDMHEVKTLLYNMKPTHLNF